LFSHFLASVTPFSRVMARRFRELPHGVYCFANYFWNVVVKRRELMIIERTQGLGDFICVLWSVRAIREKHPGTWLVLICPIDCRHIAAYSRLGDLASNAGSPFNRFIRKVCSPALLYRPTYPDERNPPERQSQRHLAEEAAHFMKVKADPYSVSLTIPKTLQTLMMKRLERVNPNKSPIVVVHPGPSWPVREWSLDGWSTLTRRLLSTANVIVIQIGVDFEEYRQVVRRTRIPGAVDWVNKLELAEIAGLLQQTAVFVGIDSGPVHIATTLGVPTVANFGPTNGHLRLHPRAPSVILSGDVPCLGCHHAETGPIHWRTGCPNNINCMKNLSSDRVYEAVMAMLTKYQRSYSN
jgi:ADP-heptose:LPS heptosyltransferase